MQFQAKLAVALVATISPSLASLPLRAQGVGHYLAPRDQVVAIRAGHLFDSRSGNLLDNQVVLIRGERIAEVGSALQIPAGATVIDLSTATVLPGMIDAHVHVNTGGATLAQRALRGRPAVVTRA
jgi:imidazolonepropionase-like amidohydrolase